MKDIEKQLTRAGRGREKHAAAAAERFLGRAEAAGLVDVAYAPVGSPFGELFVAATRKGLVRLAYPGEVDPAAELAVSISPRMLESPARLDRIRRELDEYFEGERTRFEFPIDWRLISGFATRVLRATARVPYGRLVTYREVARRAGSPNAYRAAGNALGSNPIPIVVPCHRVVREGGGLGGYTGGLDRKRLLLRLEGAHEE